MFLHVSVILFTGGWYPSMPCSRSLGGGIPACLAGLQAHTQGEVEGVWSLGGSPGPHPGRRLRGLAWGRGVSRPKPSGGIPACTEAETPPMATAVGAMHPTGMHSCYHLQTKFGAR